MVKVTSKYQVTLPKAIADRYNIRPGDHIDWAAAGEAIRVVPGNKPTVSADPESRLHWFDLATQRHQQRTAARKTRPASADGSERIFTNVAALVDTNILVYRFDDRFPKKAKDCRGASKARYRRRLRAHSPPRHRRIRSRGFAAHIQEHVILPLPKPWAKPKNS